MMNKRNTCRAAWRQSEQHRHSAFCGRSLRSQRKRSGWDRAPPGSGCVGAWGTWSLELTTGSEFNIVFIMNESALLNLLDHAHSAHLWIQWDSLLEGVRAKWYNNRYAESRRKPAKTHDQNLREKKEFRKMHHFLLTLSTLRIDCVGQFSSMQLQCYVPGANRGISSAGVVSGAPFALQVVSFS